jgi:tetratricopeptide (TPR) repeat protein
MRAGRAAAILALAATALALPELRASAQDAGAWLSASSGAARTLLDAARQSAGIGDWAGAAAYIGEAAAQDPGDSDVLYLVALAAVKRELPLGEALGSLNAALAADRFSYYTARDASTLKAELLVRERRWKEALDALGSPSSAASVDRSYRRIRARAYAGAGDEEAFAAELREALERFPDDPAFARLFLAHAGSIPSSETARELGETILSRLTIYAAVDPELPVLAAPLMADIGARRDAVLAFRAAGGSSPAATLRALEYGLIDESAASAELLSGSGPVELGDIRSLLALAGSPAGREAVATALSAWSGEIVSDRDGTAESGFSISKGLVGDWALDSKHEGRKDTRALFADGLPVSLALDRAGVEIDISYSAYPAVASVEFKEKSERRSYFFGPEAFSFAPRAMRRFVGDGRSSISFPYANPSADISERSCVAAALSVAVDSGSSRRVTQLDHGLPLSSTGYENGRLYSTTSYERGQPVLEKADVDGDGRFRTERGFYLKPDGSSDVAWIRTASQGDGVFDYYEQTVFPFRKEWDFDRNGSVDAVQFQLPDGSIEQEFSSRLDGRLDESLIVKSGKIVALSRDGVSLALLPDTNAKLTWIGRKSFDLGRNLPEGEGFFHYQGTRYRLTRIGDLAFGEIIP